MSDLGILQRRVAQLEDENAALLKTIDALTGQDRTLPSSWGLTPSQARVVNALIEATRPLSKEALTRTLYPGRRHFTESNTMNVLIARARERLELLGVTIINHRGVGWTIPADGQAKLKELAGL